MDDYKALIKLGWDDYARTTRVERSIVSEYTILRLFSEIISKKGHILDVGCGSGKPITHFLAEEGFSVDGLDISPRQAEKAKQNLPTSRIFVADMSDHKFPENTYDAVICLHVLEHNERIFHAKLLKKIYSALKPGGSLLMSANTYSHEGIKMLKPYIQMFYSHFDQFETIKFLNNAKFSIIHKKYVNVFENKYLYIIAKKEGIINESLVTNVIYSA